MSETFSPTMQLRWRKFYRDDRDETPAAQVPGWPEMGPSQYKLQQLWVCADDPSLSEWRDIPAEHTRE